MVEPVEVGFDLVCDVSELLQLRAFESVDKVPSHVGDVAGGSVLERAPALGGEDGEAAAAVGGGVFACDEAVDDSHGLRPRLRAHDALVEGCGPAC